MATRTIKLLGNAYRASGNANIIVNFNGSEVYNGDTNTTTNSDAPSQERSAPDTLASWTVDTSVTGEIPLTIQVISGEVFFTDLLGDQVYILAQENPPAYDVVDGAYVVIQGPTDFVDLNTNTDITDGKTNTTLDGATYPYPRDVANNPTENGEWVYPIGEGETFGCDFYIDPDLLTEMPAGP